MPYDDSANETAMSQDFLNTLFYLRFDGTLFSQIPPFHIVKTEKSEESAASIAMEPRGKACRYGDCTDELFSAKALDTVKACWHRARGPVIWGLIGFVIGRAAASISLGIEQRL